jgi:hypothetical protein
MTTATDELRGGTSSPIPSRPLTDRELDHVSGGYQSGGSNGSPVVHDTFSLNFLFRLLLD